MKEITGNIYVIDTSALLTLWNDEAGAEEIERILRDYDNKVFASYMSYMECYYRVWKNCGRERGKEIYGHLFTLPIERINQNEEILQKAAEIKATNSLSVADSWIIATAIIKKAIIVHKDPEFLQVASIVQLHNLPFN